MQVTAFAEARGGVAYAVGKGAVVEAEFGKWNDWGVSTEEIVKQRRIFKPNHPEYELFLKEYEKMLKLDKKIIITDNLDI